MLLCVLVVDSTNTIGFEFITLVVTIISVIIAFSAYRKSKKANVIADESNEIAKQANTKADESNQIAKESNKLTKIQMKKTTLNSDIMMIREFQKDGLVSEWLINIMSKRSLEKYIDKKKLELKKHTDEKKIVINRKEYRVLYDVIVDDEKLIIYDCGDNRTKKELYDGLYSIVGDLKFIKPFIINENFIDATNSFIKTTKDLNKVNNYKYRKVSKNQLNIAQPCEIQEFMKDEQVCKLWSYTGVYDEKYEKEISDSLRCYECTDQNMFDEKINEVVEYYKNFYYFQEILEVYKKSRFEDKLYKGVR